MNPHEEALDKFEAAYARIADFPEMLPNERVLWLEFRKAGEEVIKTRGLCAGLIECENCANGAPLRYTRPAKRCRFGNGEAIKATTLTQPDHPRVRAALSYNPTNMVNDSPKGEEPCQSNA